MNRSYFTIVCGLNSYKFNGAFYFWALDVIGEYILSVHRSYEDDTIILKISEEIASDIPFLRERCGYGLSA